MKRHTIPPDFPVQPLADGAPAKDRVTCNGCGLSWDDGVVTTYTPAPSGRCPFEYFHEDYEESCKRMRLELPAELVERCGRAATRRMMSIEEWCLDAIEDCLAADEEKYES